MTSKEFKKTQEQTTNQPRSTSKSLYYLIVLLTSIALGVYAGYTLFAIFLMSPLMSFEINAWLFLALHLVLFILALIGLVLAIKKLRRYF